MSSVNNTNGPVDFWANLKKQKEEEARQKEQEARELEMQSAMQQDEIDNLPEPEPDDDFTESEVVQEPTGDDEKEIISDGNTDIVNIGWHIYLKDITDYAARSKDW